MKPLAWITGARGLIGSYLTRLAPQCAPGWEVLPLARPQLELTDFASVDHLMRSRPPQCIIHCAAMSRSTGCQQDPARAFHVNVDATAHLAGLAGHIGFVFFSTDLVFDGAQGNYEETDRPRPLGVYAETKVEAERIVLANRRHTVVRTSLNGGISPSRDRGFNEELRNAWQHGRLTPLFTDEYRSPIPAAVTARAVWHLVTRDQPGLYHLAGAERLSRWQIGELLAQRWPHLTPHMRPGSLKEYKGAPRAPDTSLNCDRLRRLLPFHLPGLSEWLRLHPHEPF